MNIKLRILLATILEILALLFYFALAAFVLELISLPVLLASAMVYVIRILTIGLWSNLLKNQQIGKMTLIVPFLLSYQLWRDTFGQVDEEV